ncbi:MAG TPA: COX15/CtaA family protein [Candidatus Acidoferrales bacterium]|nr:COX15/CtaA family protein [Candidatus Acidoferrales bacterium]
MREPGNRSLHRFAVFTAVCTFLLLIAGALVTSNEAGLSVPTWPLASGSFFPPMVGGIRWEWSHRLVAGFVSILTIILAVWGQRVESRRWVRNLAWSALGLVIAQAILGGITVRFDLPPWVSSAHATLAELFFVTVISLAVFTSKWWSGELSSLEDSGSPRLRTLAVWTSALILLQVVLGAAFRHNAFGIIPHVIGAVIVTGMVFWTVLAVIRRFGSIKDLRRAAKYLEICLGLQLLLGGAAYWAVVAARDAVQPTPLYVTISVAHVAVGALTFAASVLLSLFCFRILKPAHADGLEAPAGARSAMKAAR